MRCPSPDQLRRLLELDPEAAEAVAFAAHLEECPACQRASDQLAETGALPIRAFGSGPRPDGPASVTPAGGEDFLRRLAQAPPRLASALGARDGTHISSAADPGAGTALPSSGGPSLPEWLGDYRILRCIGAGGMGVVYEAQRESLRSRVALKVMHPQFRASAGYLRRFHTEARSAAQLHHTNIVSVFDYGEQDGVCFYAMQFIDGRGLDRVLVEVRWFRRERAGDRAAPTEGMPHSNRDQDASPRPDHRIGTETGTDADPVTRTIAHALLTGHFAPRGGAVSHRGEARSSVGPVGPVMVAPTADGPDRGIAQGRTDAATPAVHPPGVNGDRSNPSSGGGPPTSSLGVRGEEGYYREIARLGVQVAEALAQAHQRGVLHRDIKPSNLLLDALGNVWVTDFGLAKLEGGEDLSQSRDVVGTLRYIPPERFRGESEPRGDVYCPGGDPVRAADAPAGVSGEASGRVDRADHAPAAEAAPGAGPADPT
jgi:hypothetical protein